MLVVVSYQQNQEDIKGSTIASLAVAVTRLPLLGLSHALHMQGVRGFSQRS